KMTASRPTDGAALRQGKDALYWHALPVDTAAQAGAAASAEADTTGRIAWRYYCTYLTAARFVKAEYALRFAPVYELYIDGKKVLTQGKAQVAGDTAKPAQKTYNAAVEPGLHVLIVRALVEPGRPYALPELTVKTETDQPVLALSLQARERYDLPHYLFGERVGAPKLSHDGRFYAITYTVAKADRKGYERNLTVGRTDNGQAVAVYKGVSNFAFAPNAPYFGYMQREGKKTRIYVGVSGETARPVYETAEELGGFTWAPDGSYMVVSVVTRPEADNSGLYSLSSPADQWPDYKDRTHLYKLDLQSWLAGFNADRKAGRFTRKQNTENAWLEPLTYGPLSTALQDISADGTKLLFTTTEMVDSVRVYMLQRIYLMDVQ
ncbi:MAG: hypothetical protein K2G46_00035, partial [Bacteroidales bacterium]|nr:hypothetical protein [Bacteroidales bacterium]